MGNCESKKHQILLHTERTEEYYIDQAEQYFDYLQQSYSEDRTPNYAKYVIRWEWHPWLLLTGYKRSQMQVIDGINRNALPCYVRNREYRFVPSTLSVHSRCIIYYGDDYDTQSNGIPVYEVFYFNRYGYMIFIEAWLDKPTRQLRYRDGAGWPINPYNLATLVIPLMHPYSGYLQETSLQARRLATRNIDVKMLFDRLDNWILYATIEGAKLSMKMIVAEKIRRLDRIAAYTDLTDFELDGQY